MFSLKSQIKVAAISALTLSVLITGCAKKSFVVKTVDDKVAPIDKKVTDLSAAVKDNGERIDAVDRRATQLIAELEDILANLHIHAMSYQLLDQGAAQQIRSIAEERLVEAAQNLSKHHDQARAEDGRGRQEQKRDA